MPHFGFKYTFEYIHKMLNFGLCGQCEQEEGLQQVKPILVFI